jgi:hypothetical protein
MQPKYACTAAANSGELQQYKKVENFLPLDQPRPIPYQFTQKHRSQQLLTRRLKHDTAWPRDQLDVLTDEANSRNLLQHIVT